MAFICGTVEEWFSEDCDLSLDEDEFGIHLVRRNGDPLPEGAAVHCVWRFSTEKEHRDFAIRLRDVVKAHLKDLREPGHSRGESGLMGGER
ncbi:MAG: hypothetical protein ACYTF1_14095 [Planctomycetota bacterium]